jgi:hypothetical protein
MPVLDLDECERAAWREFDRLMILACLRWNLTQLAQGFVNDVAAESKTATRQQVEHYLALEVARARPRSTIVPWHLPQAVVDRAITLVAKEFGI